MSILVAGLACYLSLLPVNASEGTAFGVELSGHCSRNLDDVFVFPDGGRKFDSEVWKREPSSRFAMLFDLYHQPLNKKTPEQIFELLGQPAELKDEYGGSRSAYYDLGLQNGLPTFLRVYFNKGRLEYFQIQQRAEAGLSKRRYCSDWLLENLSWKTVAKEYNRQCLLVGMPVGLLPCALGCHAADIVAGSAVPGGDNSLPNSLNDDSVYHFGSLEFEYSADKLQVKRFRFYLPEGGVTDWEEQNLRIDLRSGNRESEVGYLRFRSSPLLDWRPFNLKSWNAVFKDRRSIFARQILVGSFVRTYPIIGMSRQQIRKLFGPWTLKLEAGNCLPDAQKKNRIGEPVTDSVLVDFEDYPLSFKSFFLELSFKDDKVVAYRYIYLPDIGCVGDGNLDRLINGFVFQFRDRDSGF